MPGTIALLFKDEVIHFVSWHSPFHRKKIIEGWRVETGKRWECCELSIVIEETFIKNKLHPPNKDKSKCNLPGKIIKWRRAPSNYK